MDILDEQQNFEGGEIDQEKEKITVELGSTKSEPAVTLHARRRIELQEKVTIPKSYSTLFFGLKLNHPHNVAVAHPLAFVLRRILYAVVIVFMVSEAAVFFGIFLLQLTCLAMGVLIFAERQWEDPLIGIQHAVNEAVFYVVLTALMCFSGVVTGVDQQCGPRAG